MSRTAIHIACSVLLLFILSLSQSTPVYAQEGDSGLVLTPLGTYATGIYNGAASEVVVYDSETLRAFVVNSAETTIDVLDISDPAAPTLLEQFALGDYGGAINSIDLRDGILAAAMEGNKKTAIGSVVFLSVEGEFLAQVEVGYLPDMLTFTPDGNMVIVANEGEPNNDYTVDPEGSVSILDISSGIEGLTEGDVTHVSFASLNESGVDPLVRIYGPGATIAEDLEPEYVTISPDSSTAYVTLQENNAIAVIDLQSATLTEILPLGFKDYSRPLVTQMVDLPVNGIDPIGETLSGQEIQMGGFSGLWFEGLDEESQTLHFLTHTDRGPNANPIVVDEESPRARPFALPDFQPQVLRLELDIESGVVTVVDTIGLSDGRGRPLSGLPNAPDDRERAVDLLGAELEYDPLGADFEALVVAEDGTLWLADEYQPALYHFDAEGVLIDRFVPKGAATGPGRTSSTTATLPGELADRHPNRGFEALAIDGAILYAFMQGPLDMRSNDGTDAPKAHLIRIVALDIETGETVAQYLYEPESEDAGLIGDAIALGNGEFLVLERDEGSGPNAHKLIFHVSLASATNLAELRVPRDIDAFSAEELAEIGITPVRKQLHADLSANGYHSHAKPEGLAMVNANTLAIINDNDFGITGALNMATGELEIDNVPEPSTLTLVALKSTALDTSDRDGGILFRNPPLLGMFQPDAIAAYDAGGETFLVTANEGDERSYKRFDEEIRIRDLTLDPGIFPDAETLQEKEILGRLRTTTSGTDLDGDGLADVLLTFGTRSFSIWDTQGNLVWDSGNDMERLTAERYPDAFNSDSENDTFDERSDDSGPEPEPLEIGVIGDRVYVFVGLERIGGIMVYDVTDPFAPEFITYTNNRNFDGDAEAGTAGDLSPEGIAFVPAGESPTGEPLLLVANELSGTTTLYAIKTATSQTD